MKNLLWMSVLIFCTTSSMAKHLPTSKSSLAPSHESLLRQNWAIDQMGLARIQNECELQRMVANGTLSALPNNDAVKIAPSLPANRRYALPQTIGFLLSLADAYREAFPRSSLVLDSAVRPVTTQAKLRRTNRSAAPAEGEAASSHEAGTTFDLSKRMARAQLQWLRNMLSMNQAYGAVIVEEEKHCLHIEVIGDLQ